MAFNYSKWTLKSARKANNKNEAMTHWEGKESCPSIEVQRREGKQAKRSQQVWNNGASEI